LRNVVSPYFGSKIAFKWLDLVIHIVGAHEESHPVGVPENCAPDKLALV
jgi:hypothetical protein